MEEGRNLNYFRSGIGYTEETGGRVRLTLILDHKMDEYKKRMLCDSGCPHTLQVNFRSEVDVIRISYDITGYLSLQELIARMTASGSMKEKRQRLLHLVLDLLNAILECLKGMESYMLYWEHAQIDIEHIFIQTETRKAALAFYPNEAQTESIMESIIPLIDEINDLCMDAETEQYLNRVKDYIHERNPGLDGIIRMLGSLQRETSLIYWETRDFRNGDSKELVQSDECKSSIERGRESIKASEIGHSNENKNATKGLSRKVSLKTIAGHVILAGMLTGIYRYGGLDIINFLGLAIITAGVDLSVMRKLRFL